MVMPCVNSSGDVLFEHQVLLGAFRSRMSIGAPGDAFRRGLHTAQVAVGVGRLL
jgi:hypothetical protein